ncbi:MAG TPA: protein kinase [Gemmatimonadales bacterium]
MNPFERLQSALADRYRLERELGQGGMATVYLAHDLRHDRKVAVKVLRPSLAAVIGAERFLAEIKTTAGLQHPHILPLHDSGEMDGQLFYVMPRVEGESLRERLEREKQLPIPEAVRIATEVASALGYAHRHGVIHRDIKPENILLHDGQALVADFGIALAVSAAGGSRMTETGLSLGTPHYMSPEQAMGDRSLDARTDVYALGCVLYEMLTGDPPFQGSTAQAIVAKVMTERPSPIRIFRDTVPEHVEAATLTALAKLPADRFATAAEFAAALADSPTARRTPTTPMLAAGGARALSPGSRLAGWWGWGLSALLVLAAGWLGFLLHRAPPAPLARYELKVPGIRGEDQLYTGNTFALSADGSALAYVGGAPGATAAQLWLRTRDALAPRLLQGTEGADAPFFSPDGKWVAYFANGRLYKLPLSGGAPVAIADSTNRSAVGGTWLPDGSILYTSDVFSLRRLTADGRKTEAVASPPSGLGAAFPAALPRADLALATLCTNNCARMTLYGLDLRTGKWKKLADDVARSWYLPIGYLVYARLDGTVLAARFDPDKLELQGAPVPLLSGVRVTNASVPDLDISASGILVYLPGTSAQAHATVVRVDRQGHVRPLEEAWHGTITSLALSPDGTQLAVSLAETGRTDLWIKQLDRGPLTKLTFDGTLNYRPAWRPDGRTLTFTSDRAGPSFLYSVRADGSGAPERVMAADTTEVDEAEWSGDGKWLLFRAGVADGLRDIYARGTGGDTARITIVNSRFDEYMPALSPDARWVAYVSAESGREEVYVRPFPHAAEARWQVSNGGGNAPAWSHSGRELFYLTPTGKLVSVDIVPGSEFRAGERRDLFSLSRLFGTPFHRSYAVTPDDRGFIMLQADSAGAAGDAYLAVVLNWFQEVEAKVGKR